MTQILSLTQYKITVQNVDFIEVDLYFKGNSILDVINQVYVKFGWVDIIRIEKEFRVDTIKIDNEF